MYVLTRYVVWEVLKHFLATLIALTLVVTPVMGVRKALEEGFPVMVMLRIIPFMLPEILGLTIPAAMLFSVCSVFGRMTGSNEIVALKSLGISPMAVIWPVIVLAAFLSLGTVWMYEIAATWCRPSVVRIGSESIEEIAYSMLRKQRSYDGSQFSITVTGVEGHTLIEPTITLKGPQQITFIADKAELHTDLKAHVLQIDCLRGEFNYERKYSGAFPDVQNFSVPISVPMPDRYHRDWVSLRDIPNLLAELYNSLLRLDRERRENAARGLPESKANNKAIDDHVFRIRRLKAEPYRRWANGFTCLCFTLLGAPVAMIWRHADVLTNFFVCFLPILALYYPLLMLSDNMSTSATGTMPPCTFWTANVVLASVAVVLLRRVIKH